MNLQLITTVESLSVIYDAINQAKDVIAFDCETTGLDREAQVIGLSICCSEDAAFYAVLKKYIKEINSLETSIPDAAVIPILELLRTKQIVGHNILFDVDKVQVNFGVSLLDAVHTDTMILAHLLNENRRLGLKDLAATYFGEDATLEAKEMKESVLANGGQATKTNFEMYKADFELLGKYGAKDALLTYKLFFELASELIDQGLEDFFYTDECMPLLRGPTHHLNTSGLRIDTGKLSVLKATLKAECEKATFFIISEITNKIKDAYPGTTKANTFNLFSNQQLAWLMFDKYELEFAMLTDTGRDVAKFLLGKLPYTYGDKMRFIAECKRRAGEFYVPEFIVNGQTMPGKKIKEPWAYLCVDKKVIDRYAPRYEWIKKLSELHKMMKLLSTYVEGIEERLQYGVIYPSFLQHGTTSGRYSARNPNFQNLPRDDKRIKECIIPRNGNVFVGADYSQLEPRVFAAISGDERLLEAFRSSSDFYSVIGMETYDITDAVPLKDGRPDAFGVLYPKYRHISKQMALAATYGSTPNRIADIAGINTIEAREAIERYFERFPDVKKMMLESHAMLIRDGFVKSLFGRLRRVPSILKYGYAKTTAHGELPYEVRTLLNLSVNHRIQSTAASIVNRSAIRFLRDCKAAGLTCKLILQVHDSLVVECAEKDAETVALFLQNAMENTVELQGVRLEAEPKIGKSLAEV